MQLYSNMAEGCAASWRKPDTLCDEEICPTICRAAQEMWGFLQDDGHDDILQQRSLLFRIPIVLYKDNANRGAGSFSIA